MNACVFLGPSLSRTAARKVLEADYLPPAAQGDVYQAVLDGATTIGLVDGYFQGAPSVWHKEILWALERGVRVFGAASMGALRAAELCSFGMLGIGRVFEAYRDGTLSDDDEVAVVHGPEELDFLASTVPLVNVRATLEKAARQQVIPAPVHDELLAAAASVPYWERTYEAVFASLALARRKQLAEVATWISAHGVDQKRDDTVQMLRAMGDCTAEPPSIHFVFQATSAWLDFTSAVGHHRDPEPQTFCSLLDEIRLSPRLYAQLRGELQHRPGGFTKPLADLLESSHRRRLSERADDKQAVLLAQFGDLPTFADAMLTPGEVLEWYFEDLLESAVPVDTDSHARELGLSGTRDLLRLLLHELLYVLAADHSRQ